MYQRSLYGEECLRIYLFFEKISRSIDHAFLTKLQDLERIPRVSAVQDLVPQQTTIVLGRDETSCCRDELKEENTLFLHYWHFSA